MSTPLDVERLAREAGIPSDGASFGGRPMDCLRLFAESVLEEAARVAESAQANMTACANVAAAIRALKP